jgi:hypothetical protein
MFSLLESKEEITIVQRKLEATIRRDFNIQAIKNIGYPGGTTYDAKVNTDRHHWFWSKDHKQTDEPNPRRFNWFGLFNEGSDLQISVEINTPFEARNYNVAGFFGRDNETGAIYLLHSGRVGGGKKGVGKTAFLAWSNERPVEVADSTGEVRNGVLVMPVEGKAATRSAIRYIDAIASFKRAVRSGEIDTPEFKHKEKLYRDFYSEPRGRRKGKRAIEIDYVSRHGDVLDALEAWRNSQSLEQGARLVKNVLLDLGVEMGQELVEVYEIKSTSARSHIYSAIGQLMVHGTAEKCRRVIVLPDKEPIAIDLNDALQRLEIELMRFKLDKVKATIV